MATVQELMDRIDPETKTCNCICGKTIREGSIRSHIKSATHVRAVEFNYDVQLNVYNCTCGKVIKRNSFISHLKSLAHTKSDTHQVSDDVKGPEKIKLALDMMEQAKQMILQAQTILREAVSDNELEMISSSLGSSTTNDVDSVDGIDDEDDKEEDKENEENDKEEEDDKDDKEEEDEPQNTPQLVEIDEDFGSFPNPITVSKDNISIARLGDFVCDPHGTIALVGETDTDGNVTLYPSEPTQELLFVMGIDASAMLIRNGISPIRYLLPETGKPLVQCVNTLRTDPYLVDKVLKTDTDLWVYLGNGRLVYTFDDDEDGDEYKLE